MILSICDNGDVMRVLLLLNTVMTIIRIVVPIILIVTIMIEFMQSTASSDHDLVKKTINNSVRKFIAAAMIFFVPTFINLIMNVTIGDDTYEACLDKATSENIQIAYKNTANDLLSYAIKNNDLSSYEEARKAINRISDENLKKEMLEKLEDVKQIIHAKELIAKVEKSKKQSDYNEAEKAVALIKDETIRKELEDKLKQISTTMAEYMGEYSSDGYIENPLGIPYYCQCDPRWGNVRYNAGATPTICGASCGFTSFAMMAAGFNHDMSITPYTIVDYFRGPIGKASMRNYGAAETSELLSSTALEHFNMNGKVITGNSYYKKEGIQRALNQGRAVEICIPGHYMLLVPGFKIGEVVLLDPFKNWADKRRRNQTGTLNNVLNNYCGEAGCGIVTWAAEYWPR